MYNILNSISSVNLYTELATAIRLAVDVFFKSVIQMCITAIIITSLHNEVTQTFMAISKIDGEYPSVVT